MGKKKIPFGKIFKILKKALKVDESKNGILSFVRIRLFSFGLIVTIAFLLIVSLVISAFLFDIGKFGLGLYFGNLNPEIGYGAAGSIILIMLWVSYSSMIVFYGAEFTRAYADYISGRVAPTEGAKTDNSSDST